MPFPIDEKYIKQTELELGVIFPSSFTEKMRIKNGGEILITNNDWLIHPFFDKKDKKRISRTSNHIGYETKEAKKWKGFPKNCIVIGSDSYGNKLILRPGILNKKKLKDTVYEWNHETGETKKLKKSISELLK
ncbi:SMI1/KNR4 family protein [Plebeiibacterium sediminum]|uniref:SMI1/KNR4 family protein n=1 Tax=Plebeiibacterium sediminum TaxID=2992112 RepID=A0AAE3M584_9BACT|nr:SMI1/KNR4 family protein [Plebeiobacterium sediminum]MCW3786895.1 SMI1/KNR4 family protein [Plebeiobacterium sediminum]